MSSADYDPKARALALGSDYKAIFAFVRDQIRYEAYSGVLREADGTLAARAGNALDRSLLLASLLGAAKIPARIAACDLSIDRGQALYRHIFDGFEPSDAAY